MIGDYAGEIFRQIRGGEFTYVMKGNAVIPDRTNVQISKAHFSEALEHYPLINTVPTSEITWTVLYLRNSNGQAYMSGLIIIGSG